MGFPFFEIKLLRTRWNAGADLKIIRRFALNTLKAVVVHAIPAGWKTVNTDSLVGDKAEGTLLYTLKIVKIVRGFTGLADLKGNANLTPRGTL